MSTNSKRNLRQLTEFVYLESLGGCYGLRPCGANRNRTYQLKNTNSE